MAEAILSQVIGESALSARRLLDSAPELERPELLGLMEFSLRNTEFLRGNWEAVKEDMTACVESTRLRTALERILRGIEAEGHLARLLLDRAERDPLSDEAEAAKRAEFRLRIGQIEDIQRAASHLLRWLRAPRDPLDAKLGEQSLLDLGRGGYESGADLLARLQAGGDP